MQWCPTSFTVYSSYVISLHLSCRLEIWVHWPLTNTNQFSEDVFQIKDRFKLISIVWKFFLLVFQMKAMMEQAGNSHLLTILSYPNTGHLIEPPYTPHIRSSNFRAVSSATTCRFTFRLISFKHWQKFSEWFEVKMPKSGFRAWVLTAVSFACCLCSFSSVGWRDGSACSCSGRLLAEDAGLPEGDSVLWHKACCDFIFPPVTKATTNDYRVMFIIPHKQCYMTHSWSTSTAFLVESLVQKMKNWYYY